MGKCSTFVVMQNKYEPEITSVVNFVPLCRICFFLHFVTLVSCYKSVTALAPLLKFNQYKQVWLEVISDGIWGFHELSGNMTTQYNLWCRRILFHVFQIPDFSLLGTNYWARCFTRRLTNIWWPSLCKATHNYHVKVGVPVFPLCHGSKNPAMTNHSFRWGEGLKRVVFSRDGISTLIQSLNMRSVLWPNHKTGHRDVSQNARPVFKCITSKVGSKGNRG